MTECFKDCLGPTTQRKHPRHRREGSSVKIARTAEFQTEGHYGALCESPASFELEYPVSSSPELWKLAGLLRRPRALRQADISLDSPDCVAVSRAQAAVIR